VERAAERCRGGGEIGDQISDGFGGLFQPGRFDALDRLKHFLADPVFV
jgi:hypothetical protein